MRLLYSWTYVTQARDGAMIASCLEALWLVQFA
jgi:hypothetical protein